MTEGLKALAEMGMFLAVLSVGILYGWREGGVPVAVAQLARLASRGAVPVYPCIGPDMLAATERALLSPRLRRVQSPREAAVLLATGDIPHDKARALDRVHDQLPHPRAIFG